MIITITILDSLIKRLKNLSAVQNTTTSGASSNRDISDAELKVLIAKAVESYVSCAESAVAEANRKASAKATAKAAAKGKWKAVKADIGKLQKTIETYEKKLVIK